MVNDLPLDLFRRHVGHRAHHHPDSGQRLGGELAGIGGVTSILELGKTEIHHLDSAVAVDHDVRGLEVAVDDALVVGRRHRLGERGRQVKEALDVESILRDHPVEGPSIHQLHRQEPNAACVLYRVNRDNVGMIERRHRPRLAFETVQPLRVIGKLLRQHLERYLPPELGVLGPPHLPHPTRAERRGDAVVSEGCADHRCSSSRCCAQLRAISTCAAACARRSNSTNTKRSPEGDTSQFNAGAVEVTKAPPRFSRTTRGGPI